MSDTEISFFVNDEPVTLRDARPTDTLLEVLRGRLRQTGTKEGCAEGDCGACTVALLDAAAPDGPRFRAVNSCLLLVPLVHGQRIYTVEGLRKGGAYHMVQESLVQHLGSQCGYCTPGVIMSMFEACYRPDLDAEWKLDDQMCGNLCRCTGYRPIREATVRIAGARPADEFSAQLGATTPGLPPPLDYEEGAQRFAQPGSWERLFDVLDDMREPRFVVGASDLGLHVTKGRQRFRELVSLASIPELRGVRRDGDRWWVGAATPLADLEAIADREIPIVASAIRFFGSRQIKNRATVGGNLCNASPIGDLAPVMLALGATVVLRSRAGERRVPMESFFLGYRQTALQPGEIMAAVAWTHPPANSRRSFYKVSKRREMDISSVCAGLYVELDDAGVVQVARFGFGGMAATPARATQAEQAALGKPWTAEVAEAAANAVARDFTPLSDHRGSAWFRATVAANLLRGFFEETERDPAPRFCDRPTGTVNLPRHEPSSPTADVA